MCNFSQEIYPGQFQPSPCHKFISMMDKQGKLLRNYTQNIDTLEQVAGVQRIIQCHGKQKNQKLGNFALMSVLREGWIYKLLVSSSSSQDLLQLHPVLSVNTKWIVKLFGKTSSTRYLIFNTLSICL